MLKPLLFAALLGAISLPAFAEGHADPSTRHGDLTISDGWVRATTSVARASGGFLTIHNAGEVDERLLRAHADFAMVQVHKTVSQDGVNRMQEQTDGVVIPAGESVALMPGSYHLMFMGLDEGIPMGASREVTLVFEQAGEITVTLPAQMSGQMSGHGTNDHEGH